MLGRAQGRWPGWKACFRQKSSSAVTPNHCQRGHRTAPSLREQSGAVGAPVTGEAGPAQGLVSIRFLEPERCYTAGGGAGARGPEQLHWRSQFYPLIRREVQEPARQRVCCSGKCCKPDPGDSSGGHFCAQVNERSGPLCPEGPGRGSDGGSLAWVGSGTLATYRT